mgnify:CR=1 FL=1
MATRSPEGLKSLTQSVLSGIEDREAEARRRRGLSPDVLKQEQAQERISRRAWGGPTSEDEIRAEQKIIHREARRLGFGSKDIDSRKTARGQVSMIGSPPPTPER